VIAKPADSELNQTMARREVAAWVVARELGWPDLVAATVLRDFEFPDLRGEASVQIVWGTLSDDDRLAPPRPVSDYAPEDRLRGAVFDAIVLQADRGGNNRLSLPEPDGGCRLALIDHGYSFQTTGSFGSDLHAHVAGSSQPEDELPGSIIDALDRLAQPRAERVLRDLLRDGEYEGMVDRVTRMRTERVLLRP
jgi:hypothetical protein